MDPQKVEAILNWKHYNGVPGGPLGFMRLIRVGILQPYCVPLGTIRSDLYNKVMKPVKRRRLRYLDMKMYKSEYDYDINL